MPLFIKCSLCEQFHQRHNEPLRRCGKLVFIPAYGWIEWSADAAVNINFGRAMNTRALCRYCRRHHTAFEDCVPGYQGAGAPKTIGNKETEKLLPVRADKDSNNTTAAGPENSIRIERVYIGNTKQEQPAPSPIKQIEPRATTEDVVKEILKRIEAAKCLEAT